MQRSLAEHMREIYGDKEVSEVYVMVRLLHRLSIIEFEDLYCE